MAKTKKRTKKRSASKKKAETQTDSPANQLMARKGAKWDEALKLETALEEKLLEDAILSAKLAVQELEAETRKQPFERRSGLRLRDKALKTESAFNRLRALRKGELLPAPIDE
jgi:hypothetical protein